MKCNYCSIELSSLDNVKDHVESIHGLKFGVINSKPPKSLEKILDSSEVRVTGMSVVNQDYHGHSRQVSQQKKNDLIGESNF